MKENREHPKKCPHMKSWYDRADFVDQERRGFWINGVGVVGYSLRRKKDWNESLPHTMPQNQWQKDQKFKTCRGKYKGISFYLWEWKDF